MLSRLVRIETISNFRYPIPVNKSQAIKLLEVEGWTKADAIRALEVIDFNANPDEILIRRSVSMFAGSELNKRQRLQAAQKGMVTKRNKEIELKDIEYNAQINQLEKEQKQEREKLEAKIQSLFSHNNELTVAYEELKKDNKNLKNIVDKIKLKLAIDVKNLLQYEDSEIRRALVKWFKGTQG